MYNWEIRRKFRTQKSFRPVFFSFIPKKKSLGFGQSLRFDMLYELGYHRNVYCRRKLLKLSE